MSAPVTEKPAVDVGATAEERAWSEQEVPCRRDGCDVGATWHALNPCGHSSTWCERHRDEEMKGMADASLVVCAVCVRPIDDKAIIWRRL